MQGCHYRILNKHLNEWKTERHFNTDLLSSSRLVLHMFVPFFGSKHDNELLLLRQGPIEWPTSISSYNFILFFHFCFYTQSRKRLWERKWSAKGTCFNLLTNSLEWPKSVSPYNIDTQSRVKVMRTMKMITRGKILWSLILSTFFSKNVWRSVWRVCM